ncbi:hypothetical protein B9Z52_00945 [Limnohabitans sp. Jir72]|nr:hypothetical protein B9Z52_00945 [Limnohabitans sp. Jir72]
MMSHGEDDYGLFINIFPSGRLIMERDNWGNSFKETKKNIEKLTNNKVQEIEYATWNGWEENKYFCDIKSVKSDENKFYTGNSICHMKRWFCDKNKVIIILFNNSELIFEHELGGPSSLEIIKKLEKIESDAFIAIKPKGFFHPMSIICEQCYFTDVTPIKEGWLLSESKAHPWIYSTEQRTTKNRFINEIVSHLYRRYEIEIPFNWNWSNELYRNEVYVVMESSMLKNENRHITCSATPIYRDKSTNKLQRIDNSSLQKHILEICNYDLGMLLNYFHTSYIDQMAKIL